MFNALFKVCESSSPERTQRERFTTEAFCGVLRSDPRLLESFLREFAGVEDEKDFTVVTEKPYESSFIDVTFENQNYLIFLEIKVNSSEGKRGERSQLEVYADILKNQNKKAVLLFCSKFIEIKDPSLYKPIEFKQFLWRDIYSYLQETAKTVTNPLVTIFLTYLESQKMSKASEFTIEDLQAMQRLSAILKTLDQCFYHIRPKFEFYFGKPSHDPIDKGNYADNLNQLLNYNRYSMHTWNLDWTQIMVAFCLGNHDSPQKIRVTINTNSKGKRYQEIIKSATSNGFGTNDNSELSIKENDLFIFGYEKEIKEFICKKNQFNLIEEWCDSKLKILYQFMIKSKQKDNIPWKVEEIEGVSLN